MGANVVFAQDDFNIWYSDENVISFNKSDLWIGGGDK